MQNSFIHISQNLEPAIVCQTAEQIVVVPTWHDAAWPTTEWLDPDAHGGMNHENTLRETRHIIDTV